VNISHPPAYICVTYATVLLAVRSHFTEAFAAIYRPTFTGFKGHFGFFAALGANRRVHLAGLKAAAGTAGTAGTVALGFPGLSAVRAPLGLIGVAFGLEELLLRSGEGKRSPAIGTC
jgi:hypothetical protein